MTAVNSEKLIETKDLAVYELGPDWVVAKDKEDAIKVLEEHWGSPIKDMVDAEEIEEELNRMDPDRTLRLAFDTFDAADFLVPPDATKEIDGGYTTYKATAAQWAEVHGRGFLASEEW